MNATSTRTRGWPLCLLALLVIIALGAWLRCQRLANVPLALDEGYNWRVTRYPAGELIRRVGQDTYPPGHFLLLRAWTNWFGTSPFALRSLSIVCGVLCIPLAFVFCRECALARAGLNNAPAASSSTPWDFHAAGPLFAAAVLAVHPGQLVAGRGVRMYALGALLALLTSWLMVRALRSPTQRGAWCAAYALAAAGFLYTHYLAFFTVAAQALFVVGLLAGRAWHQGLRKVLPDLHAWSLGACLVAALYSPWIPNFIEQVSRVQRLSARHGPTLGEIGRIFWAWAAGFECPSAVAPALLLIALGAIAVWAIRRRQAAVLYCLLAAALPWAAVLVILPQSGWSTLSERYLTFGQVSLVTLCGVLLAPPSAGLVATGPRWACVLLVAASVVHGADAMQQTWPNHPPAIASVASYLAAHHAAHDVLLVEHPSQVGVYLYYLERAGLDAAECHVRCPAALFPNLGPLCHASAMRSEEFLGGLDELSTTASQLWSLGSMLPIPPEWKLVHDEKFSDGSTLRLYSRRLPRPARVPARTASNVARGRGSAVRDPAAVQSK